MAKTYIVKGMMCNHCKANVEKTIAAIEGVESVEVSLSECNAVVEGDVDSEKIISAVCAAGYDCSEE